jgi:hypothetical protein
VARRLGRLAVVAALAAACLVAVQSTTAAAGAPRIALSTPHAWQVVQRDRNDRADLVVSGRLVGVGGSVRVVWGDVRATASCDRAGRFTVRLADVPVGQATLLVRSARLPDVVCARRDVGVGDIYVVAGQSNASGRSRSLYSYSSPTLRAAMFGNDYRWQELQDPVDSSECQVDTVSMDRLAGGSVWPEVATDLLAAEGVPVAFVPCARSSTLIADWRPDLPARRPAGTLYTSMARRIAAVGGRVRAVLWWQGERDARLHTPGPQYKTTLRKLASSVWQDFRTPLIVAQLGDYDDRYTEAGVDTVRLAQEQAWARPHILQGPVLYDIDLDGDVHVRAPADVAAAAHRWAVAILRSVLHLDAGRTPRLVHAAREGDEVVLTADSPLAGGADIGGILVSNNGREVAVVSASTDGDTVRLLLGESAEGPLRVSLGQGRSAAGTAVPTDASAWRLPMLPFVRRPVAFAAP